MREGEQRHNKAQGLSALARHLDVGLPTRAPHFYLTTRRFGMIALLVRGVTWFAMDLYCAGEAEDDRLLSGGPTFRPGPDFNLGGRRKRKGASKFIV